MRPPEYHPHIEVGPARLVVPQPDDNPRDDGYTVAAVVFVDTGEIREQVVAEAAVAKVQRATVERRLAKHGRNATPHMVIG